jgi:hypothetical protein
MLEQLTHFRAAKVDRRELLEGEPPRLQRVLVGLRLERRLVTQCVLTTSSGIARESATRPRSDTRLCVRPSHFKRFG